MNNTKDQLNRLQQQKQPYPYDTYDVSFENKADGITLAGTLTMPKSNNTASAVLLVAGMGPNDRDYTMMRHKLLLVLADYLTRQGIAVLRYDKRGVGQSTGIYDATLTSKDFARDVHAGIEYLKSRANIDHSKIGLIGHSEGGMISSMVAAQSHNVAFVVLLAAPVSTGIETNLEQVGRQLHADGASDEMIRLDQKIRGCLLLIAKQEQDTKVAETKMHAVIAQYLERMPEAQRLETEKLHFAINQANANSVVSMLNSPWYRFFLTYDPAIALKKLTMPVLALNGSHDWITISSIALPIIDQALKTAGNKNYMVFELPHLNHWFQTCRTGALAEYGTSEEAMSPVLLKTIAQWICNRVA